MVRALLAVWFLLASTFAVFAQSWVQIEAHPSLREAQDRARAYSNAFSDVNGFRLSGGWYALALGPYSQAQARARLLELRAAGLIPRDAYVSENSIYRQRFWPVGANVPAPAQPAPETTQEAAPAQPSTEAPAQPVVPQVLEETPREARASERLLTRDERRGLQTALQWFGFYTSAIDGAFGRGTRASMARWQEFKGLDVTGVLTTRQRDILLEEYDAALTALGLETVDEDTAGITITMPAKLVNFEKYEYPFVHYAPKDGSGIRVLLISQAGDATTLAGLYEIMQTLEIVPLDGERRLRKSSFVLTGQNAELQSYTFAELTGGYVKGFTLAFPPERASDMARVIEIMRDSFTPTEGALDPSFVDAEAQAVDLLAGLELRRPKLSRSGFYVDGSGRVVTHAEAVQNCSRITLDDTVEANVTIAADGVALLEPKTSLSPLDFARFSTGPARLRSELAVSGYSYEGALDAPTLTYGRLADLKGLNGEAELHRLDLDALPGDLGGPVLTPSGAVAGMLVPQGSGSRALPQGTQFALHSEVLAAFLSENGVTASASDTVSPVAPEDLVLAAADITVLVGCW